MRIEFQSFPVAAAILQRAPPAPRTGWKSLPFIVCG
jgi:hypothetical protein